VTGGSIKKRKEKKKKSVKGDNSPSMIGPQYMWMEVDTSVCKQALGMCACFISLCVRKIFREAQNTESWIANDHLNMKQPDPGAIQRGC